MENNQALHKTVLILSVRISMNLYSRYHQIGIQAWHINTVCEELLFYLCYNELYVQLFWHSNIINWPCIPLHKFMIQGLENVTHITQSIRAFQQLELKPFYYFKVTRASTLANNCKTE